MFSKSPIAALHLGIWHVLVLLALFLPVQVTADDKEVLEPTAPLALAPAKKQAYQYLLEGRPDPFLPFLSEKVATQQVDPDEIIEEKVELTGMRKFEPGQLTLVAIMIAGDHRYAMVEDVSGRGYVLTEGMPIGRRGMVTGIGTQEVRITETAHTRSGKEIKNYIVMRLKKEGEQ